MGFFRMFSLKVNGVEAYAHIATVDVTAGDVVTVELVSYYGYATNATLTFTEGVSGGNGGSNEPDGTIDNPYVIEELPYTITVDGQHDEYYVWTPSMSGQITITRPAGNYVSSLPNYDTINDNCYLVEVVVGEEITLNPWGNNAGSYTIDWYDGNAGDGGNGGNGGEGGSGGEEIESAPMSAEDVTISDTESIDVYYTPIQDGILTVTISADPGFKFWVYETPTLPASGTSGTYTYELVGGVEYCISIIGYHEWSEAAATITYDITFEGSEISSNVEDLLESDVELVVGEQNVELLPNAITTLFNFAAPETGVYTITIPEDVIAELYSMAWISYQISENNTLVFTATAEGQVFLIGLTSEEDSMNIKIEKTGDYIAPEEVIYENFEGTCEVDDDFEMPEGDIVSIDISEKYTIVLGNDGYYHLNTFDGPVIFVNLNSDGFALGNLFGAGAPITMRGEKYEGEDGKLYCYDYLSFMSSEYYSYSQEKDYYPLNADLMQFFVDYGAAQGWYKQGLSDFEAINAGDFEEESAWMVAMAYVEGFNGSATSGTIVGDNAQTGDFGVIAAAIAMGVSAICGTAVIAKKKEN